MPKNNLSINDFPQFNNELEIALLKIDPDGDLVATSANIGDILSLGSGSEMPDTISQLSEILIPDDIAFVKLTIKSCLKKREKFDMIFASPNSSDEDRNYTRLLITPDQQASHFNGYLQKISTTLNCKVEFYKSEERFKHFIHNMPFALSVKDLDGKYVVVNKQWHIMFDSDESVEGKTVHDIIPADKADKIVEEERSVFETGISSEKNSPFINTHAEAIPSISYRFPIKGKGGQLIGLGVVHTDMSKQNAVAQELNRAKEAAEIANRSKSEFLANMSHELRTPLNAIIGFSEILQNELFGPMGVPSYKEYVDDINDGARHLLEILNDILDMSKVEAGEYHLEEEIFEAHAEVDRCLRFIKERAAKNGLSVDLVENETDPILNADRRVFKQILLNLLSNAVKFTDSGGKITIRLREDIDGCLEISVADTGIGISEEDLPVVLQPFGQADTSLTRQSEGTGLGLSLVQRFMDLHQGHLHLESSLDQGTSVYVTFPPKRWSWEIEDLMQSTETD